MSAQAESKQAWLDNLKALRGVQVLVTGGCGFLGRNIVSMLLQAEAKVRVFDIRIEEYDARVQFVQGDLLNEAQVTAALKGVSIVFHVASPPPTSNNPKLFQAVNVDGTRLLLQLCERAGVQRFVLTSSASVQFDGTDQRNFTEESPMPAAPMDAYTASKLEGETLVLRFGASAANKLATCAIRPHGIFGPHDPHFVPALATTGKTGKSKYMIGNGSNVVDFTYVDNVSYAHLLAATRLTKQSKLNGQAYLITNKQPVLFWDFVSRIYSALGYPLPTIAFPVPMMLAIAKIPNKTFNKQRVTYAGRHHYYNCDKATRDFGYIPPVNLEEGLARTIKHFKYLENPNKAQVTTSSSPSLLIFMLLLPLLGLLLFTSPFRAADGTLSLWSVVAGLTSPLSLLLIGLAVLAYFVITVLWVPHPHPFAEPVDLTGKVAVVTGGNKGIGFSVAKQLADRGCHVILACRDMGRAQTAAAAIAKAAPKGRVTAMLLDLSSFRSVHAFVAALRKANTLPVHYLINNAGAVYDLGKTADGLEQMFQCNYLSHALLVRQLLEQKLFADHARIVHVSSRMYTTARINWSDLNCEKRSRVGAYSAVKLMQILYSNYLNTWLIEQGSTVRSVAMHPGAVSTDMHLQFLPSIVAPILNPIVHPVLSLFPAFVISADLAAHTVLYSLLSKEMVGVGGVYIEGCTVVRPLAHASNTEDAKRLFDATQQLLNKA